MFTGALRISAPGPIDHIRGYDEDWGEAAYLAVQMTGTQAGLLGGATLVELWIVVTCLASFRPGPLPRVLCVLGTVAVVHPLGTLGALGGADVPGALWLVGIAALVLGLPVWCLATGTWLLTARRRPVPA